MPLKPEYKQPTLDALRSGRFAQQQGAAGLVHGPKCCIAVSAVVNGIMPEEGCMRFDHGILLTQRCANFIGLTRVEQQKWERWNDVDQLSFPQIADKIEKEF